MSWQGPRAYHGYYTSDRVIIAIAAGTRLVHDRVPGVDGILEPAREAGRNDGPDSRLGGEKEVRSQYVWALTVQSGSSDYE